MVVRALACPESPAGNAPAIALEPRDWQDTRWLGQQSGYATSRDLLAGAWVSPEARRTVSRLYAAACADLAQATVGGLPPHSADWERWFAALRTTARQLSPSQAGAHVVRRALHHGQRLEGSAALWSHQLRRGFVALLAAQLAEPVPALIGEDLLVFRGHDDAWLAQDSAGDSAVQTRADVAIQEVEIEQPDTELHCPGQPARWPTSSLRPHPLNPRGALNAADVAELCASIVAHAAQGGILQPLLVTPDGTIVAGHRRLAAALEAGLRDVPVIVCTLGPIDQLTAQLTENLQRADLTPVQEARAYCNLLDAGATQASIARAVGVPASRVRERLALLDLDQDVQDMVHRGELPMRVALQLVPLRDQAHQRRLARHAVRRRLTVAQMRNLIETALHLPPPQDGPRPADDEREDEERPGLSLTRQAALDALRAEPDRPITFGQLADLAARECCACGLSSAPAICAECPNLHLLHAVLRRQPRCA
jgi:ParB family transcriptional regulator, chromosome partitioning protein